MKELNEYSKEAINLLSLCVFNPTAEKMNNVIHEYKISDKKQLYIKEINNQIVGILGITLDNETVIINHIAVAENYRNHGLGRIIINFLQSNNKAKNIIAETDNSAVRFYEKCGFIIENLGEKYKGTIRYKCILENNKK